MFAANGTDAKMKTIAANVRLMLLKTSARNPENTDSKGSLEAARDIIKTDNVDSPAQGRYSAI